MYNFITKMYKYIWKLINTFNHFIQKLCLKISNYKITTGIRKYIIAHRKKLPQQYFSLNTKVFIHISG